MSRWAGGAKSLFPALARAVFGSDYEAAMFLNSQLDSVPKPALLENRLQYPATPSVCATRP